RRADAQRAPDARVAALATVRPPSGGARVPCVRARGQLWRAGERGTRARRLRRELRIRRGRGVLLASTVGRSSPLFRARGGGALPPPHEPAIAGPPVPGLRLPAAAALRDVSRRGRAAEQRRGRVEGLALADRHAAW